MNSEQKIDFGSLDDHLRACDAGENLARSLHSAAADDELRDMIGKAVPTGVVDVRRSAGPISDAYILSVAPVSLITGPAGSAKTTSSVKKALVETARIYPGPDGVRRYVLGVYRQNYKNLWSATIPSWWKILPQDLPGSKWTGAKPRPAEHIVNFEDAYGRCQLIARFEAFGDIADPEDLLGKEFTDCYLNEMSTFLEVLMEGLMTRVGREPPRQIIRRSGRIFGDANAPDVLNYCYTKFYEASGSGGPGISAAPNGYTLYRQPGALDPNAENIDVVGREYYLDTIRRLGPNHHRVKRMVHARPGFARENDPVYAQWDDERNCVALALAPVTMLPIVVGLDGGFTPAAVYMQFIGRQLRILDSVALERGGMRELADCMLELEARRFPGCEFYDSCDPSMAAGEDLAEGSDRSRLSGYLKREVHCAPTNEVSRRIDAVAVYFDRTLDNGTPGLVMDISAGRNMGLRRGFNQTYHFVRTRGTNDLARIEKTPDSHVHDALQAGALIGGTDVASKRASDRQRLLTRRREEDRRAPRRNPLARSYG